MPVRGINELMGCQADRRGEREGSTIGTRYLHMTVGIQAWAVGVIAEWLAVALALMPQMHLKSGSGVLRPAATRRLTSGVVLWS